MQIYALSAGDPRAFRLIQAAHLLAEAQEEDARERRNKAKQPPRQGGQGAGNGSGRDKRPDRRDRPKGKGGAPAPDRSPEKNS